MENLAESDRQEPWRHLTSDEQVKWAASLAADVKVDRVHRTVSVAAKCTACEHYFTQTVSDRDILIEPVAKSLRSRDRWTGVIRFVLSCRCTSEHPGRPNGVDLGCGAAGRFLDKP